jgi:hypothetical protein
MSAREVAAGAIVTEVGTTQLDYFTEKLFAKLPQDITFTKRYRRPIAPVNAVSNESPLQFDIHGKRVYITNRAHQF